MSDLALITLLFSCAMLGTLATAALLAADARAQRRKRVRELEVALGKCVFELDGFCRMNRARLTCLDEAKALLARRESEKGDQ